MKRLIGILTLHLLCFVMLLLPDNIQGPVIYNASGINLRLLDIIALLLIVAGSTYLFGYIYTQYKEQIKDIKEQLKDDKKQINDDSSK